MIITRVALFAVTLLACSSTLAQNDQATPRANAVVNKCTGADGSVIFSDKPCADSQKAQKVDTSAALRTGSGGHNEAIVAGVADTDCRKRAQQSAYQGIDAKIEESNRHIADYQKQKSDLAYQKVYAPDGSGKMIDDPSVVQRNAKIDAALATEQEFQAKLQTSTATAYRDALKACDAAGQKSP